MTDGLDVYGGSLALLTDLYQLTMACGYWKAGVADREAVFHLTFRRAPFGGAYAIAAGIGPALSFVERLRFAPEDLAYLAELRDAANAPLFPVGFLDYLGALRLACSIDAVPEGSVVFAHEPLVRVRGPIAHAQLLETPLLTLINYQTLVATKAARVCQAARGAPVLEFGLRRAHGIDGGLAGSRAAYIGGVAGTSNVLAGRLFGIPVRGTHAHSWVMFHETEPAAFRAYAAALPGNCTFLVDTYDTIEGVRHAIEAGQELRAAGHALGGVRLDSGDLAHLSIEARRLLDAAGFPDAKIVASNDLDERLIGDIIDQGARIDVWGVGTKLVTAYDQPALGGVYKLGAARGPDGAWRDVIKLSEQPIKISNPGALGVKRLRKAGALVGDVIYDATRGLAEPIAIHDVEHPALPAVTPSFDAIDDLLQPMHDRGKRVAVPETRDALEAARARAASDLAALSPRTKRFLNPQPYAVGLDDRVHRRKLELDRERARMTEPLVFATEPYDYLGAAIAAAGGWERGVVEREVFPDGERYCRIDCDPADRDAIVVGGTIDDHATLALYDLACGLVTEGAYRVRLVIPYFGYSTMERSTRQGEIVTAKTRARLLSSIPQASRGTQVFLLDLHVASIAHYFEGGIRPVHVYAKDLVTAAARRLGGDAFVLACTDAGRAKWVESLANDLGVDAAFVYKRRTSGSATHVTGVSAQVAGKRVVIYDDMIRTGGSLVAAAQAYRDAGAVAIDAIATHGLFPDDSLARIRATGLFGRVVTTDSHPRAVELASEFLQVASIADLLAEHLKVNR